jgi:hypothetical protein
MKLIKYRDAGLHTYTYFYVDDKDKVVSPYFDSSEEAEKWLQTTWDNWKASKECGS